MSESVPNIQPPLRIFSDDLTVIKDNITFHRNEYPMKIQVTAFGDCVFKAVNVANVVSENSIKKPADHLSRIYKVETNQDLHHGEKCLCKNIEVSFLFNCVLCVTTITHYHNLFTSLFLKSIIPPFN